MINTPLVKLDLLQVVENLTLWNLKYMALLPALRLSIPNLKPWEFTYLHPGNRVHFVTRDYCDEAYAAQRSYIGHAQGDQLSQRRANFPHEKQSFSR